jgi:hypothetical protein
MKRVLGFLSVFALAGTAFGAELVLQPDGFGRARIGMGIDQLEQVLMTKLAYQPFANRGCGVVTTRAMEPMGVSYQIESKFLTRINVEYFVNDPRPLTIKTEAGVGLGSSEEEVLKAYGARARVQPNSGDPTWHTIYVDEPDHKRGVVFETNGKTVKTMRAGDYPSITDSIGCR